MSLSAATAANALNSPTYTTASSVCSVFVCLVNANVHTAREGPIYTYTNIFARNVLLFMYLHMALVQAAKVNLQK